MRGRMIGKLVEAGNYGDEAFIQAEREGRLDEFIAGLPVVQNIDCKNLVLDNFVGMVFQFMLGAGSTGFAVEGTYDYSLFSLHTNTGEPTYTEYSGSAYYAGGADGLGNQPTNPQYAYKWCLYNVGEPPRMVSDIDGEGRNSITMVNRFLFLPSQGPMAGIRSCGLWWSSNGLNTGNHHYGLVTRIRLKDSGGNPITLDKSTSQALLMDYRLTLISN